MSALLLTLVGVVGYAYLFFCVYILVMGVQRAHLDGRLHGPLRGLCLPMVALGYAMDLLANVTVASLAFWELPRELLVTKRLQRHLESFAGWRWKLATWICNSLLDPFDPSGKHC